MPNISLSVARGTFLNPSDKFAHLYKEEMMKMIDDFKLIAFAIFLAGYESGNYTPFSKVFKKDSYFQNLIKL